MFEGFQWISRFPSQPSLEYQEHHPNDGKYVLAALSSQI